MELNLVTPETIENQMNTVLSRLGLNSWTAVWAPGKASKRGEIFPEDHLIVVYDESPTGAWDTFTHETIELKLRPLTNVYRLGFNALVEAFEKIAYAQKEQFIDKIPSLVETIMEYSLENEGGNTLS